MSVPSQSGQSGTLTFIGSFTFIYLTTSHDKVSDRRRRKSGNMYRLIWAIRMPDFREGEYLSLLQSYFGGQPVASSKSRMKWYILLIYSTP